MEPPSTQLLSLTGVSRHVNEERHQHAEVSDGVEGVEEEPLMFEGAPPRLDHRIRFAKRCFSSGSASDFSSIAPTIAMWSLSASEHGIVGTHEHRWGAAQGAGRYLVGLVLGFNVLPISTPAAK